MSSFSAEPRTHDPSSQADVRLDLKALAGAVWAKKLWILIPATLAFGLSFLYVNLATPRYAAEARILVENRETPLTRSAGANREASPTPMPLDQEAVASQVQIIYSRDIARAVIQELGLARLPEFDPAMGERSPLSVVLSLVGLTRDLSQMTAEERALEIFTERLAAYPVDRSRVIEIRFTSRDPDLASRVANAVAERFIETQLTAKLDRDRRARQHLERTIADLRQAVAQAEQRVQEHRARHDLLTGTSNQTLGVETASELNTQLTTLQGQQAEAQARATAIRDMLRSGRPIESAEIVNSPAVQRLVERRAQLRAELAQAGTVLLPGHPRMRELQAQIADNDAQTRAQAERVARGLESDARIAADRAASLRRALDDHMRRTAGQGEQQVALAALEREARAQRELLENWLALYRESSARDSLDARAADARVVSAAVPPSLPAWPRKLPIILVATLSTLFVMLALVFTGELLSGRAFVTRDAGRVAPVFAAVAPAPAAFGPPGGPPDGTRAPLPPAAPPAETGPAGAARARAVRIAAANGAAKRIAVTSAVESDGRMRFALELGRALAAEGRRAVLVEAALAAPELAREAGVPEEPGLAELIAKRAHPGEVIQRDPASRLHLVAAGHPGPAEAAEDVTVSGFLAALDAAYDHVIVLLPALAEAEVATVLASRADRTLVVGEANAVTEAALAALEPHARAEIVDWSAPAEPRPELRAAA
jgi:uncharacterized protein involved in exopolysaccharide biosynthesis/Mrp family chromosome partitioning ATPase